MKVYQVIRHEYNSDDGHYEDTPYNEYVYANEADAIKVRDSLNDGSITEYNSKPWRGETIDVDPTDVDAVEAFANRQNCLTYFTIETLRVFK